LKIYGYDEIYGLNNIDYYSSFTPDTNPNWDVGYRLNSGGSGDGFTGSYTQDFSVVISVYPISISTPTPTPSPVSVDCIDRGDDACCYLDPPWYEDGQCYTFLPGGDIDLPNGSISFFGIEITLLEGLPSKVTFPGFQLCTRYLHFSAGFMGFEFEEIAATITFIIALGMAYGEIRK